jgi:hypothetical protein
VGSVLILAVLVVIVVSVIAIIVTPYCLIGLVINPRLLPSRHHPRANPDLLFKMKSDVICPVLPRHAVVATEPAAFYEFTFDARARRVDIECLKIFFVNTPEVVTEFVPSSKCISTAGTDE